MGDPSSASADRPDDDPDGADSGSKGGATGDPDADATEDIEALRRQIEEKYDFDDFGPAQMREMTAEEWNAAFDPDTWIVGPELLDRVEADLKNRIATRDVFAVLERYSEDGQGRLLAYSDEDYAIVYPDGSVEGRGTVLRDVKPTVALCSMDGYDVPDPPTDAAVALPRPDEVPEGSGELGNRMLQVIAFAQILAGLGLFGAWLFLDLSSANQIEIIYPTVAIVFVGVGLFLFTVVANARLSDRFRSEEYRNRLRGIGLEDGERPDFLPVDPDDPEANARLHEQGDGRGRDAEGT